MVLRDRNHPSIVRWSQSNEENLSPTDSTAFATDLYTAITALDPTRPVSADLGGAGHSYDAMTYPNFATFGHYLDGLGMYTEQVGARPDRPFGQGEFVWPSDQTAQGMMWFATGTAAMRAKDASEIRPYTLLSAWASVIPGVRTTMMKLEPTYPAHVVNPPLFGEDNLADPWSHPILLRIQRAFHPVLVADLAYWQAPPSPSSGRCAPTAPPGRSLRRAPSPSTSRWEVWCRGRSRFTRRARARRRFSCSAPRRTASPFEDSAESFALN